MTANTHVDTHIGFHPKVFSIRHRVNKPVLFAFFLLLLFIADYLPTAGSESSR
jgi:hypothetical protein